MKRSKTAARKSNQLQKSQFQILQKVFAKQRGYVHWPAIIVEFHPIKSYIAKVEFFGWNHEWAYVSFNNLLEPKDAEKIVQKNFHKAKFAKAVNEMNIWRPPIPNMRIFNSITECKKKVTAKPSQPKRIEDFCPRLTRSQTKSLLQQNEFVNDMAPTRVLRPRKH